MLPDLFSRFDPAARVAYRICPWLFLGRMFLMVRFLSPLRFIGGVRIKVVCWAVASLRVDLVKSRKINHILGVGWLMTSVFLTVLMVNFCGLIPWSFRLSSHLVFSLALALPLWLVRVFVTTRRAPWGKLAIMIGTALPDMLASIVGLIETVRVLIRPLTLALRLVANIVAGHIIIGLLMMCFMSPVSIFSILLLGPLVGIYLFELAVCVVQAYVFILLLGIYIREWAERAQ